MSFGATPLGTLARSLSRLVLSMAYDSLVRNTFGTICAGISRLSMFQEGCGIGFSQIPFLNSRLTGVGVAFRDHNSISNEMSAFGKLFQTFTALDPWGSAGYCMI
jgi:hypothetical protein